VKKIRFGLIGCGNIGKRHAEHISNLGELSAVCDVSTEKVNQFSEKYKCPSYLNFFDLLDNEKNIDVISVCTPNGLHSLQTIESLRRGKHVVCEKPMATTVKDCELMISESEKANKRLFIIKQNRYNPPVIALKKLVDEQVLGKILSIQLNCFWNRGPDYYLNSDWKGRKVLDGGTLFTQFSHFIDLVYWLFGDIRKIKAYAKNLAHQNIIEFEDSGVVIVEFDNGALGSINYTVNSFEKNMEGSLTVFGEKGTIKIGGQYLNKLDYQCIKDYVIPPILDEKSPNDYGLYQGSMSNHDKVYENVIEVLNDHGIVATNGMEGLKVVQIIERIYTEIENHR